MPSIAALPPFNSSPYSSSTPPYKLHFLLLLFDAPNNVSSAFLVSDFSITAVVLVSLAHVRCSALPSFTNSSMKASESLVLNSNSLSEGADNLRTLVVVLVVVSVLPLPVLSLKKMTSSNNLVTILLCSSKYSSVKLSRHNVLIVLYVERLPLLFISWHTKLIKS